MIGRKLPDLRPSMVSTFLRMPCLVLVSGSVMHWDYCIMQLHQRSMRDQQVPQHDLFLLERLLS